MNNLENEPGANADANAAGDDGHEHALESTDAEEGLSADTSTVAADAEHLVGAGKDDDINKDEDGNDEDQPQNPDAGGSNLLRSWGAPPPTTPINYDNADETPYEHNFEPGDHIIRWDMLPILWPIQIHGIVLEVSEDKSEVTICDFGVTSVKNDKDSKKIVESQSELNENILEEENAKFNEAIQDDGQDAKNDEQSESTDASTTEKETFFKKKKQARLHVRTLTKWSDLRKWHKVDYEGGLLNVGRNVGVGKGLKKLGKKTEDLWNSMAKSFAKADVAPKDKEKVWQSIRYDVDEKGYCVHHPDIQLKRLKDNGDWTFVRKKCPECIKEDCPTMMGEESPKSKASSVNSAPSFSSTEAEQRLSQSKKAAPEETELENSNKSKESNSEEAPHSTSDDLSDSKLDKAGEEVPVENAETSSANSESDKMGDDAKTLAQMITEANEIEKRSRKTVVRGTSVSPKRKPVQDKRKSWHGSFMKSLSNISIFPQKDEKEASDKVDSKSTENQAKSLPGENGDEAKNAEKQPNSPKDLPRSDPPVLVLARTRFILEHGENILPPYHIINSNSECIAVWCKTGRWSTLQASVFLHSTAIGHAKSATALTLGVAATQPWLIPAFATVGVAAVGAPWLLLKVANDKWNEATRSLTEEFWMQAEPEVFIECIDKWSSIAQN